MDYGPSEQMASYSTIRHFQRPKAPDIQRLKQVGRTKGQLIGCLCISQSALTRQGRSCYLSLRLVVDVIWVYLIGLKCKKPTSLPVRIRHVTWSKID
ncbi:Uncharacterized protein HZ326_31040 [Fusarium oxysporum f. sp. albedinis]|nr:Uncharacterized protein HZ326_31040 [Fusarium oxysporum f. sp. albedinis]